LKFELVYNDVAMKVKSTYKAKDKIGDVDIGCGSAFGGDEEGGPVGEEPVEKVIDVAFNTGLVEYQMSKADFMTYIKNLLKNIKGKIEEGRVADFQKGANDFIKFVVSKFDDFTFYTGTSENIDEGSIALSYWENDSDPGPVFFFFKDALKEVKY